MCDNICVAIRVRPLIDREKDSNADILWTTEPRLIRQKDQRHATPYAFDMVFDQRTNTEEVYESLGAPILDAVMQGFNGTIFAYGQTASGKTFTMLGSEEEPGFIPMAIQDIFQGIENRPDREFLIRVSYLEIYNENVVDLLGDPKKILHLKEDKSKKVVVDHLNEEFVDSPDVMMDLLRRGQGNRHLGSTNMNECSSRSHTIFRVIIESQSQSTEGAGAVMVSQLNLVDLAGSEKAKQTGATGQRLTEGININKSLSNLSHVISQLSENPTAFVNYRDSKLTRILQSSLGGNSKTVIICNMSPASLEESVSTLRFATSAKKIQNKPVQNEVLTDEAMLKRYKYEVSALKKELESMKQTDVQTENQELHQRLAEKEQDERQLQEKYDKLTKLTLCVSSQSSSSVKRKKRRETWCPGKVALSAIASPRVLKSRAGLLLPSSHFPLPTSTSVSTGRPKPVSESFLLLASVNEEDDVVEDAKPTSKSPAGIANISYEVFSSDVESQTEPVEDHKVQEQSMQIELLEAELQLYKEAKHPETEELRDECQRLKEELATAQNVQTQRNNQLTEQVQRLQDRLDSKQSEYDNLMKHMEQMETEHEEAETELEQQRCQVTALRTELATVKRESGSHPVVVAAQESQDLQPQLHQLQVQHGRDLEDIHELKDMLRKVEDNMAALQQENTHLQEQCQTLTDAAAAQATLQTDQTKPEADADHQKLLDAVAELEKELEVEKGENDFLKSRCRQLADPTPGAERELDALRQENSEVEKEYRRLAETVTDLEAELKSLKEDHERELELSRQENAESEKECQKLSETVAELEKEMQTVNQENDAELESLRQASEEMQQQCQRLSQMVADLEREKGSLKEENAELKTERRRSEGAPPIVGKELKTPSRKTDDLEHEYRKMVDTVVDLEKVLEAEKLANQELKARLLADSEASGSKLDQLRREKAAVKQQKEDIQQEYHRMMDTVVDLEKDVDALKRDNEDLKKRQVCRKLGDAVEEVEREMESMKGDNDELKKKCQMMSSSAAEVEREMELIKEKNEQLRKRCKRLAALSLSRLANEGEDTDDEVVLGAPSPSSPVRSISLGSDITTNDVECQTECCDEKAVTMDTDQDKPDKVKKLEAVIQKYRDASQKQSLRHAADLEEVRDMKDFVEKEMEMVQQENEEMRKTCQKLAEDVEMAKVELETAKAEVEKMHQQVNVSEEQVESQLSESDRLRQLEQMSLDYEKSQNELELQCGQISTLKDELEVAKTNSAGGTEEVDALQLQIKVLEEHVDSQLSESNRLTEQLEQITMDYEKSQSELELQSGQISTLKEELEVAKTNSAGGTEEADALQLQIKVLEEHVESRLSESNRLTQQLEQITMDYEKSQSELELQSGQISTLKDELEVAKTNSAGGTEEVDALQLKIEVLEEHVESQLSDCDRLTQQLEQMSMDYEKSQSELELQSGQVSTLKEELDVAVSSKSEAVAGNLKLIEQLKLVEVQLETKQNEYATLMQHMEQMHGEHDEAESELEQHRCQVSSLKVELDKVKRESMSVSMGSQQSGSLLQQLQTQHSQDVELLEQAEVLEAELQGTVSGLKEDNTNLQDRVKYLEACREVDSQSLKDMECVVEESDAEINTLRLDNEELKKELQKLSEEPNTLEVGQVEPPVSDAELQKLKDRIKYLEACHEVDTERLQDLERSLDECDKEIETLKQQNEELQKQAEEANLAKDATLSVSIAGNSDSDPDLQKLRDRVKYLEACHKVDTDNVKELEATVEECDRETDTLKAENEGLKKKLQKLSEENNTLEVSRLDTSTCTSGGGEELQKLKDQVKYLEACNQVDTGTIKDLETAIEESDKETESLQREIQELKKKLQKLPADGEDGARYAAWDKEATQGLKDEIAQLKAVHTSDVKSAQSLRDRVLDAENTAHDLTLQKEDLHKQLAVMSEKLCAGLGGGSHSQKLDIDVSQTLIDALRSQVSLGQEKVKDMAKAVEARQKECKTLRQRCQSQQEALAATRQHLLKKVVSEDNRQMLLGYLEASLQDKQPPEGTAQFDPDSDFWTSYLPKPYNSTSTYSNMSWLKMDAPGLFGSAESTESPELSKYKLRVEQLQTELQREAAPLKAIIWKLEDDKEELKKLGNEWKTKAEKLQNEIDNHKVEGIQQFEVPYELDVLSKTVEYLKSEQLEWNERERKLEDAMAEDKKEFDALRFKYQVIDDYLMTCKHHLKKETLSQEDRQMLLACLEEYVSEDLHKKYDVDNSRIHGYPVYIPKPYICTPFYTNKLWLKSEGTRDMYFADMHGVGSIVPEPVQITKYKQRVEELQAELRRESNPLKTVVRREREEAAHWKDYSRDLQTKIEGLRTQLDKQCKKDKDAQTIHQLEYEVEMGKMAIIELRSEKKLLAEQVDGLTNSVYEHKQAYQARG